MLIRFKDCYDETQYSEARMILARDVKDNYSEYIKTAKACGQVEIDGWYRDIFDIYLNPAEDDDHIDSVDIYVKRIDE